MTYSGPSGQASRDGFTLLSILVLAGFLAGVPNRAPETGVLPILVFSLVAPAPNEAGMARVALATGSPPYGCPSIEVAVVPNHESTFTALIDIVAEARLSSPLDERDIRQATAFRATSSDGRASIFGGRSDARDVNERVYRITEEAWDLADRTAQDALSQAGCTTYTELYGLG